MKAICGFFSLMSGTKDSEHLPSSPVAVGGRGLRRRPAWPLLRLSPSASIRISLVDIIPQYFSSCWLSLSLWILSSLKPLASFWDFFSSSAVNQAGKQLWSQLIPDPGEKPSHCESLAFCRKELERSWVAFHLNSSPTHNWWNAPAHGFQMALPPPGHTHCSASILVLCVCILNVLSVFLMLEQEALFQCNPCISQLEGVGTMV